MQVDGITETEWNQLLDGFADASIYQTWAYGAVSWGEKQLSHLILRRDDAPVAMAQVRIVNVPMLGLGVAYVRWGPVCTPRGAKCCPAVWQAVMEALIDEYVGRRGLALRVLPSIFSQDAIAPAITTISSDMGLAQAGVRPYQTFRVDLQSSLAALRAGLAHKWRNQLNAAERNDLEVREGTGTELYRAFSSLYCEMFARKQFETSVSVAEFQRIQERLPASQKMIVLICQKNGRPLSGLVASATGTTGIYLLGATGDDGLKAKGSYLLQWHLIRRLKQHGCEWYDLGGINKESNPGVYHFKQGLGGEGVLQVGPYDLHRNPMSHFLITAAERLKILAVRAGATRK